MEKTKGVVIMSILFVLLTGGALVSGEECRPDLSKQNEVEAYVGALTGFDRLEGVTKSLKRVDINDVNTPFLHREISSRKNVWRVEMKNVRLKLKGAEPQFKDKYVRTFAVFVDPNTGHLLKITSKFDGHDPNMLPEPPAEVAEQQITTFLGESYLGFPNEPPKVNFLDALGAGLAGNPLLAKEIEALYVMHSRKGLEFFGITPEPRPRWVITLRGLPPREGTRVHAQGLEAATEEPAWGQNHSRNIVDAATGKCLMGSNIPQPLPPADKKKE